MPLAQVSRMNDTYESFEALYIDLALAIALVKIQYPDRMDDIRALLQDTGWVTPELRLVPGGLALLHNNVE